MNRRSCKWYPIANDMIDQANNTVIQGLTGQLKPILEKVLGPPEEQLTEETKAKVVQLVQYLQK